MIDMIEINKKYYSKELNLFIVEYNDGVVIHFKKFKKFYKWIDKDLRGAYLYDYNFKDKELRKYNLDNAIVSTDALHKLGRSNEVLKDFANPLLALFENEDKVENKLVTQNDSRIVISQKNNESIEVVTLYMSDLHIEHNLMHMYPNGYTLDMAKLYFRDVISKMLNSIPIVNSNVEIFIIGDTFHNFSLFKEFFKMYRTCIFKKTFFILGNHEFWDKELNKKHKTIEGIVSEYRDFLSQHSITLLENDIFIPGTTRKLDKVLSYSEIMEHSKESIHKLLINKSYVVLGGIGYAGLNESFNYHNGIYRGAPINRESEIERSQIFENLHNHLKEIVGDIKVFVVTHMAPYEWTNKPLHHKCVYIHGHTHRNKIIVSEGVNIYSDNQIGYKGSSFRFKHIETTISFNVNEYEDGIHEINHFQYNSYYKQLNEQMTCNRDFKKILMIKREGYLLFLAKNHNNKLLLLDGGAYRDVSDYSKEYFYNNIVKYAKSVESYIGSFNSYLEEISMYIRKIGGSGIIHGCIVDIDTFNHVYVDPITKKLINYNASSIKDKYIYKNFSSLLKNNNGYLYDKYNRELKRSDTGTSLMEIKGNMSISDEYEHNEDTEMYRISRLFKSLQYITSHKIIRLWNDNLLRKGSSLDEDTIKNVLSDDGFQLKIESKK